MLDDASSTPPSAERGAGPGLRGQGAWGDDPFTGVIESTFDDAFEIDQPWIVEPLAEPDASPPTSDSASPPAHGDRTSSQVSPVSWDSGLRESDDSMVGAAAGGANDAETSDLFKAPSRPNDDNADEVNHTSLANDDGGSGSPGSGGTGSADANPGGTVSEPTDSITTTAGTGTGSEPGSSGTSPGTPDPASTRADAFGDPAPTLGFDPEGDASAAPDWARDDFEVERALNEGRLPPEFDGSGLGRQWTGAMTGHDAARP